MSEDIPGYTAIHWEPLDLLSAESMNRMSANIQAIHNFMPRARWTAPGGHRDVGVKILSGRHLIPRKKGNESTATVRFGGFFSGGCQPNITTGINSRMQQNVYCTFSGTEGSGLTPNNDGFVLHVQIAKEDGEKKKIARNIWIHWQAMGY